LVHIASYHYKIIIELAHCIVIVQALLIDIYSSVCQIMKRRQRNADQKA